MLLVSLATSLAFCTVKLSWARLQSSGCVAARPPAGGCCRRRRSGSAACPAGAAPPQALCKHGVAIKALLASDPMQQKRHNATSRAPWTRQIMSATRERHLRRPQA